jgi:hypothetical protein
MFALRTKTGIKPMFENELETFAFGHRFANDCCQAGEHKVRPYIGFGHWLDSGYYNIPENL